MDGPLGGDVLVVPNEVNLLPDVAKEAVDRLLTQISGSVQPVGPENSNIDLCGATLSGGIIEGIEEGGTIVPFKVEKQLLAQLVSNDVEVPTVGPIVPEVDQLQRAAVVHEEDGVELMGPRPWGWVC